MDKTRLFYCYDTLCGWCFGFSPVIVRLHEAWKDRIDFEVMSGGMIVGPRVGPVSKFDSIIRGSKDRLESLTGVRFGDAFWKQLDEGVMTLSSIRPGMALTIAKHLDPTCQVAFASALQHMVYVDGLPPDEPSSYAGLAERFGFDRDQFLSDMEHPTTLEATQAEFDTVSNWGITGFPSVVVFHKGQGFLVAQGYTSFEEMDRILGEITAS